MPLALRLTLSVLGSLVYATAGLIMGAQNAGWFGLDQNANALAPMMGIGTSLVLVAFAPSDFNRRLGEAGGLGVACRILLIMGSVLFILGPLIDFAILGTLSFGFGLVCLAVAVWRTKVVPMIDRVLITLSAVGSLTWNTETVSAFLLTGVGIIWVVLSLRLLPEGPAPAPRPRDALT